MNRKGRAKIVIPFLLPAIILYAYFFMIPAVKSFYISLNSWNGFNKTKAFVGLQNFIELSKDEVFGVAIVNTLYYTFVGGLATFAIALLFTFFFAQKGMRGKGLFSNLFYFPNMVSQAALSVLWAFVFNPNFGLFNNIFTALGIKQYEPIWLGSRWMGITSITLASVLSFMGFYLILLIAGLDKIPGTYYEVASVEGASEILIFFKVTLPLLWDVLVIAISLWVISAMKYFEFVWALTMGGPANQTHTIGTYMYLTAFGQNIPIFRLGYATAISVVMFVMVVILVGGFRKIFEGEQLEY